MSWTGVLIGGPEDGTELQVPTLLNVIRVPYCTGPFPALVETIEPTETITTTALEYVLAMYLGRPSKDDLGRLRYVFKGHE